MESDKKFFIVMFLYFVIGAGSMLAISLMYEKTTVIERRTVSGLKDNRDLESFMDGFDKEEDIELAKTSKESQESAFDKCD